MRKLRTPEARARMPKWGTKFVPAPALCIGDVLPKQVLKWDRDNPQPSQDPYETCPILFECVVVSIEPDSSPAEGFFVQCSRTNEPYPDNVYDAERQQYSDQHFWVPPDALFEVKP